MRSPRPAWLVVTCLALLALLSACSDDGADSSPATSVAAGASTTVAATASSAAPTIAAPATAAPATVAAATTAPSTVAAGPRYYLSLGDSYASGFEAGIGNTRNGFAYQVADATQASAQPLELVNLGCAGATSASVLTTVGCPAPALGPDASPYDTQTQIDAAEAFVEERPGEVDLITLSIGGNDVTRCVQDPDVAGCVSRAVGVVSANVTQVVQRLRAAAGPDTLIVGTTYPDVILGEWVTGGANGQQLAALSVAAFQGFINPALASAYAAAEGAFVDVTAATGAYSPLSELTDVAPYGSIPVPVAKVCELTYYCGQRDIHPKPEGYRLIADLILVELARARSAGG